MSKKISFENVSMNLQAEIYSSVNKLSEKYRKKYVGRTASFGEQHTFNNGYGAITVVGKITDAFLCINRGIDKARLMIVVERDDGKEFTQNIDLLDWIK
jgi:hypothetical protein